MLVEEVDGLVCNCGIKANGGVLLLRSKISSIDLDCGCKVERPAVKIRGSQIYEKNIPTSIANQSVSATSSCTIYNYIKKKSQCDRGRPNLQIIDILVGNATRESFVNK